MQFSGIECKKAAEAQMERSGLKNGQNPEKRAFSLPYISYNVHYTNFMISKNKSSPLPYVSSF